MNYHCFLVCEFYLFNFSSVIVGYVHNKLEMCIHLPIRIYNIISCVAWDYTNFG